LVIEIKYLIKKGAEAEIWFGKWLEFDVIFKIRKPKLWRNPELDRKIRIERTIKEAKIIYYSNINGIDTPYIYDVDKANSTIILEYVKGKTLKEIFENNDPNILNLCFTLGKMVGNLHNLDIVHGDITLSNIILRNEKSLCLLDFGLANFSKEIEDKGVDLHLFLRSLESSFPSLANICFEKFKEGYKNVFKNYKEVFEKVIEIRRRGRYVAERRKTRIF